MLRRDFARTTDSIGATDFYKMAMDFHDRQKQKELDANEIMSGYQKGVDMQRQNALADALQSGDEEAINKAAAAYDPQAAMQERLSRMAEQRKFDQQKELLGIKNNYDAADFDRRAALAKEIAQIKAGGNGLVNINMGANGEAPVDTAQMGLDTLQDIADRDSVGAWTRFRKGLKLTSDQEERDLGAISSSIAAIAPEAISKLKAAGVSGINTMAEFLTYLGLPENPTSQEIAGALPQISAIIGKSRATTAQQTPVNYKEKYGLR
jgi:hypothetical protein